MNPARAGLQGVRPPVRRPIRFGLTLVAAVLVGACGSSTALPSDAPAESTPPPSASISLASPTATPTAAPTDPLPTETSAPPSPSPSAAGPAAACTGNDDQRDFFASIAAAVEWDVYCPVLPDGWFVDKGTYRLAGGGWMEITYRGPGGAQFVLREGAFCREEGDCVPNGMEVGAAGFGDREGTLVAADDGSWAITVDRGHDPAWLATGTGLDEAAFRGHAEALALVGR